MFAGPNYPDPLPWRYSGVTMCLVFVVGLLVLPFAPETKGQPLPEEDDGGIPSGTEAGRSQEPAAALLH